METLIDPKTLARIDDMPLVAKTVAEGFLHGIQSSRQRGVGIEFNQYRAYEPGDPLSRIDWKLFARSDRYYVREAERESEIEVWFLLDTSYSMQMNSVQADSYIQSEKPGWNKLDYAKHLIASLSYLAQKQGDSIGFLELGGKNLSFIEAGVGNRHWRRLLQTLTNSHGGRYLSRLDILKRHLERLKKPSLIFFISDFYEHDSELTDFISQLNGVRSEVVALQPITNEEVEFGYDGAVRFKDLETQEEILISAKQARNAYLSAYNAYQSELQGKLKQQSISHQMFSIDEPLDRMLYEFLKYRTRMDGS